MGLIDSILGAESGGNPNAQNPRSSAGGAGQFIDATWLDMLAKHRPDIKGTPDELLALKFDPKLSKEMTEAYAGENGKILSNAGLPVTPGTTYLAHFAGPQGAVNVLKANPGASVGEVLGPQVMAANPFLRGMTVADLQGWADKKMGASPTPQQAAPQPAPASPASPPISPVQAIPQQAPPTFAPPPVQQPQPQGQPSLMGQIPAEQAMPPPIFAQPQFSKLKIPRFGGVLFARR